MKYYIITGTSSGIGEALAKRILNKEEKNQVISLSRRGNMELEKLAEIRKKSFCFYQLDLRETEKIEVKIKNIFQNITATQGVYLINNAAILTPVAPVEKNTEREIVDHMTTNLISPMILTSSFIRHTSVLHCDKRILNISSGSAKYLLPSQSCYSTSKAGLDSFTKSVSLEQKEKRQPVRIASVYPGIIETKLQKEIRSVHKDDFPLVHLFQEAYEKGELQTADETANLLLELLFHEEFGEEEIVENLANAKK